MGRLRVILVVAVVCLFAAAPAEAQEPDVDALVRQWLESASESQWQPWELFSHDCQPLVGWRRRGFDLLATAKLPWYREELLVLAWRQPLARCADPRLEEWFFERLDEKLRGGGDGDHLWESLSLADSPGIRQKLEAMMYDESRDDSIRLHATTALFRRHDGEYLVKAYLRVFETKRLRGDLAFWVTVAALQQQPERIMQELGRVLRQRPELADQHAFHGLAESSAMQLPDRARMALARDLRYGLVAAGNRIDSDVRLRLEGAINMLSRDRPDHRPPP